MLNRLPKVRFAPGLVTLGLVLVALLLLAGGVLAGQAGILTKAATAAGGGDAGELSQPISLYPLDVISPTSYFVLYGRENNTVWLRDEEGHALFLTGARPRLSPDGRYVVYSNQAITGDLYVRDLQTNLYTRIFANDAYVVAYSWTADGSQIVFDYDCHIYVMDSDGANQQELIGDWPPGGYHCWNDSPHSNPVDGRIAWENEWYGIGVADDDGGNPYWVPNTVPEDYSPMWSPDGQWIAFWRDDNVYKIRPDGTSLTDLTFLTALAGWMEDSGPWTPDGRYLVAPGTLGGQDGLYVVPAEGSGNLFPLVSREWDEADWVGSVGSIEIRHLFLPLIFRH